MAKNNATSSLAAAVTTTSQVTITVQPGDGAKFSAGYALIYNAGVVELITIVSISGDVLTVTRASGGTTALTWSISNIVSQGLAGSHAQDSMVFPVTTFKTGATMVGDAYSGFGDPSADLHPVQKQWADFYYYPANQPYQTALGYTPIQKYLETGHSVALGWNGNVYAVIDGTYQGILWTSSNYNPASKAYVGSTCPWSSGIWEVGRTGLTHAGAAAYATIDAGAPWCIEGMRIDGNGEFQPYIRAVWLRNQ